MVQRAERKDQEWVRLVRPYLSSHRVAEHRFSPQDSALLVIDMQRYFLDESSHAFFSGAKGIVKNVERLVSAYRARSLPVIFTRHGHPRDQKPGAMARWWGDLLREDDEMSEIIPQLMPRRGEKVIRKSKYSAFVGTDLEKTLRSRGASSVLITGVMTHLCCETTARDAFMRDFDVFFVIDGTASETEDLHVSSLKTLADGFAIPVTTAEVLRWMKR
ncbi:MAG: isochorismatase family protein [Thermoplasmata archaeon]